MKLVALVMLPALIGSAVFAQTSVNSAVQTSKPAASNSPTKKQNEERTKDLFGGGSKIEGPITTEIYADEAFFDSNKNVGVFTGHVKVLDPRFSRQSDQVTVELHNG